MTLLEAVHSEAGTFHSFAAACTSIMRAAAPPLRTYLFDWRTPRLPPVENSPQARLRATLWPGVGYSMSTLFQAESSSSAMSCARPVIVPWPISARTARIRVVLSGRIATQTVISGDPSAARTTAGPKGGRRSPSASPPPTAALLMRKVRRGEFWLGVLVGPPPPPWRRRGVPRAPPRQGAPARWLGGGRPYRRRPASGLYLGSPLPPS